MSHSIEPLLGPNSVAVIGASDSPSRIGGRPIAFSKKANFQGAIYPVNPKRDMVQGLQAYPSIKDVPEVVDCAIVSVPANIATDAIRDCADTGVKSAIVFTSGFAEMDEEGARAQDEIEAIIKASDMRVTGPNCLGTFNNKSGWYGTFGNTLDMTKVPPGPVGIVTQSGAYGAHVYNVSQDRRIGATYWVTTGNEIDVDVAEVIEFYAQTDDIDVIVAYAEGMKSAERIRRALEMARDAKKPVIFMKVGTTAIGAQAAASHTASLAGSDAVYDALFRQYGVYRAETTEEMIDIAYACQFGQFPKGRKIDLRTISGGVGVQMADASHKYGMDVAPMPDGVQKKLKEMIPFAAVKNPVDFTAQALNDTSLMRKNVSLAIEEGDYDSHIIYLASVVASPLTRDACQKLMRDLRAAYPDELMAICVNAAQHLLPGLEKLRYPCFEDPSLTVRAMAALSHFGEVFERGHPDAPPPAPDGMLTAPKTAVAEHEAKIILASAGIPVSREELVSDAVGAIAVWRAIKGPVVMKITSPDIPHKTEIGGVILNIDDEADIAEGYETLIKRAKVAKPDAKIDGVIVAEMSSLGVETVMGVIDDPVFGPAVMFGLGGVFVEVLKDVTFRLAPFGVDEAHRMIDEIQGRTMLDGMRGQPPADIDALAQALAALSVFAHANTGQIESIDVNPFIVMPKGAVAVDALIIPKAQN